MHRHELSDQQWARMEPFLPHRTHHGQAGHPFNDHRPLINGIRWILHTGAPWRDLPERYGPWKTVPARFYCWRGDGTLVRIVTALLDELDDKVLIDHDLWCIDGTVIRASRAAAGVKKQARRLLRLAGDKGCRYQRIRRRCRRRAVEAVIPTRKDQPRGANFDKTAYKRRNIVERVVAWYKEYRRLGTLYEKLAINHVAMWLVAIVEKAPDDYCRTEASATWPRTTSRNGGRTRPRRLHAAAG